MKNINKTLTLFLALACTVSSVLPAARTFFAVGKTGLQAASRLGQIGLQTATKKQLPMQAQIPQISIPVQKLSIPSQAQAFVMPTFRLPTHDFIPAQKPAIKKVAKPSQATITAKKPEFESEMPEAAMDYLENAGSTETTDAFMPTQTSAEEASDFAEADLIEHSNTPMLSPIPERAVENTATKGADMHTKIAETAIDAFVEHNENPMQIAKKGEIVAAPQDTSIDFHEDTPCPTRGTRPNNPANNNKQPRNIKPSNHDMAIVAGIAALSVSMYGLAMYAWTHKDTLNTYLNPQATNTEDIDFSARKKIAKPDNRKVSIILDKTRKKILTVF